MEPEPPFIILYLPELWIYLTPNTFIRYRGVVEGEEKVGMILSVNPEQCQLRIQQFLTWSDIVQWYVDLPSISCWPTVSCWTPRYLCDTDVVLNLAADLVVGLAFVFYDMDEWLSQLVGVTNTYCMSSHFSAENNMVIHQCTFKPFLSSQFSDILPSCFPSMLFNQILSIKDTIHRAVNTRLAT